MPTVHLLSILAFAISSNFDNVGVGIAYGIRGTCIPFASNLIIALNSGTGTLLSMLVGTSLYRVLKPEVATVVGGLTMIGIGIWVIIQGTGQLRKIRSPEEQLQNGSKDLSQTTTLRKIFAVLDDPFIVDPDCTGNVRPRESVLLGLGLDAKQSRQWSGGRYAGSEPFSGHRSSPLFLAFLPFGSAEPPVIPTRPAGLVI